MKYCIAISIQFFLFNIDLAVSRMKCATRLPKGGFLLVLMMFSNLVTV